MNPNEEKHDPSQNQHQFYSQNYKLNPFDQSSSQLTEAQDHEAYPLCLDQGRQSQNGRNTPLSRLSETTYHSEIKLSIFRSKQEKDKDKVQVLDTQKISEHILHHSIENKNETLFDYKSQIKQLTMSLTDLQSYTTVLEKRNEQLVVSLQKQKLKNSHLQHAINLLRKDDQHLDQKLHNQCELYAQLKTDFQQQRDINLLLTQKLQNSAAQNNYFKQLILIANNNYEILERKYAALMENSKKVEEVNLQKEKQLACNMNEMKLLLTNLINSPKGSASFNPNLSFGEQDENCCLKKTPLLMISNRNQASQQQQKLNGKKPTEELYRKMFLKTLKTKK